MKATRRDQRCRKVPREKSTAMTEIDKTRGETGQRSRRKRDTELSLEGAWWTYHCGVIGMSGVCRKRRKGQPGLNQKRLGELSERDRVRLRRKEAIEENTGGVRMFVWIGLRGRGGD